MSENIQFHQLENGLTILGNYMPQVGSVAFSFNLPCGSSRLPAGTSGAGEIITDWIMRGAGDMDSRQLVSRLDSLGLHRGGGVGKYNMSLASASEASSLFEALDLYADIILRPKLDDEQFALSRELSIAEINAIDDDPRRKVMIELRRDFFGRIFGTPAIGNLEDLSNLTPEATRQIINENFNLSGTTFSIAGKFDFDAVVMKLQKLFDCPAKPTAPDAPAEKRPAAYRHIQYEGSQVHIGMMTPTIPVTDKDYYNAMATSTILSGGMSSRLFTEVREKRGLCYSIGAKYGSIKDHAGISCYAGTTPEKAQQTLDVAIGEFNRLREGFSEDELQRARAGMKSVLIMQSESTSSRAGSMAGDYCMFSRVRTLDEIKEAIENLSVDSILTFLNENPFEDFNIVTIGPVAVDASAYVKD